MPSQFAGKIDIGSGIAIAREIGPGEGSVPTLGFIEHPDEKRDLALIDQPDEILGRALGTVGGDGRGRNVESVLRAFDHGAHRLNFGVRMARLMPLFARIIARYRSLPSSPMSSKASNFTSKCQQ